MKSSTPACSAMALGRQRIVARDHHGAQAHAAQPLEALADAGLEDVFQHDHAGNAGCLRRPAAASRPARRRASTCSCRRGGNVAALLLDVADDRRRRRPCGCCRPSGRSMPLMRVWAVNSTKRAPAGGPACDAGRPSPGMRAIQVDDALAFGRLVGGRGQGRQVADVRGRVVAQRHELRGTAIADRDGAGLVEQQRIHVAGHFDGLAALGDDVGPQRPVHAGDADGRQQGADRRRDQADQQGHQRRDVGAEALHRLVSAEVVLSCRPRRGSAIGHRRRSRSGRSA